MIVNILTFAIALAGCVFFMALIIEILLNVCIRFYEVGGVKFLSRKRAERYARLLHEIREQMVEVDDIKKELEVKG